MLTVLLLTVAKKYNCPSVDEWIQKKWYKGIIFSHKKKLNSICAITWKEL
jgi:hypothetical protein